MLGLQEAVIMDGCEQELILPPKSRALCWWGFLEPKVM